MRFNMHTQCSLQRPLVLVLSMLLQVIQHFKLFGTIEAKISSILSVYQETVGFHGATLPELLAAEGTRVAFLGGMGLGEVRVQKILEAEAL